jgi:hypothetical protein
MRKALLLTTGLAWLGLIGSANAFTVSLTPGPMNPQYFESEAAGQNGFTLDGITWTLGSGTAHTDKGTTVNVDAAPLGMGTGPDGTTYMGVQGGSSEVATWTTPQTSLSIYWGSIDGTARNLNSFAITIDTYTLIGADLVSMFGAFGTGSQTDPQANQLVTITGLGPFTTATFSSTANAFEFSIGAGVPEASTWAMMGLGFAGLGYAAFRRNTKGRALAI